MDNSNITCYICDKQFTAKKNLYRHIREVHNIEADVSGKTKCPECRIVVCGHNSLVEHLKTIHDKEIESETLAFKTLDEFEMWKKNTEKVSNSLYVKHRGEDKAQAMGEGIVTTIYCHREGQYHDKVGENRQKLMKGLGTNKIGSACPSRIIAKSSKDNISVTYYTTHVGHCQQLGRLLLSEEERTTIAGLIASGVSYQQIIEKIRSSASTENFSRLHLIMRSDLHNIKKSFLLFNERLHDDEVVSTDLIVKSLRELDECPLLYYKQQRVADEVFSEDDICIIIMTSFQKKMLCRFGSEKICIDATHDTNKHKFYLHTILVVDEFGSGCPVAFCISNCKDQKVVELFLKVLVENLGGPITTSIFMSDDDPAYYNAWSKVMGPAEKQLLCIWHVERSWNLNLMTKIKNVEKRILVFKMLQVLLQLEHPEVFEEKLRCFLNELQGDEELMPFYKYFVDYYAKRSKLWAYCYRHGAGINTNMYLEAFHKVLKHVYFEGRKNQRLDSLITILLKISRDKFFERMIKSEKNYKTTRLRNIEKSHLKATTVSDSMISPLQDGEAWEVTSSEKDRTYLVVKQDNMCERKCKMICTACNICIHMYSCTCVDNMIKLNICKHIHACTKQNSNIPKGTAPQEVSESSELLEIMPSTSQPVESIFHDDLHKKVSYLMGRITTSTFSDIDRLTISKKLDKLISLVNDCSTPAKERDCKEPANKKVKLQPRSGFFSTHKRKKQTKKRLEWPTRHEKQNLLEGIVQPEIINIHTQNDHSYYNPNNE